MAKKRRDRAIVAGCIGFVVALLSLLPNADFVQRLGIDALLPARHAVFGPLFDSKDSDVVLVVIDEDTHRLAPFADTPEVAWTSHLAQVITNISAAGPTAIGLDIVFPKTLSTRSLLPGYDKPFLKALSGAAKENKLVMGGANISSVRLRPFEGQIIAGGGEKNLAYLNLLLDGDKVIRRYAGSKSKSMATELAQRAGFDVPEDEFILNFNTGPAPLPIYSVADLYHCGLKSELSYFERFHGKIVLIGEVLDIEDRHQTSRRFANQKNQWKVTDRCMPALSDLGWTSVARPSMPGVAIHATAVNTIAKDRIVQPLSPIAGALTAFVSVTAIAFVLLNLSLVLGAGTALLGLGLMFVLSVIALQSAVLLPFGLLLLGGLAAFPATYLYRLFVEDKDRRFIRRAFQHYLSPVLVDQLSEQPETLKLGGETRHISIMFIDLANYTMLSERLADRPEIFGRIVNAYLSRVSMIIEKHDGYIDKFIGDGIMAMWNAPATIAHPEQKSVRAALDALDAMSDINRDLKDALPKDLPASVRIGLHAGPAIVGNMGSETRFNYTAVGDTVNLAARLEGANKVYGTQFLATETVRERLDDDFLIRQIDKIAVVGKSEACDIFEISGPRSKASRQNRALFETYDQAFTLYQDRKFAEALEILEDIKSDDAASAQLAQQCEKFINAPPPAEWDGRSELETK